MIKSKRKSKQTPTLSNGVKVGRLKMSVAKAISRRCADIYISPEHIRHIELSHGKELATIGIDALSYVKMIVQGYNQIRAGRNTALLLVVKNTQNAYNTAVIDLNFSTKKGVWEVKTAQPRRTADIEKTKMLWQVGNA